MERNRNIPVPPPPPRQRRPPQSASLRSDGRIGRQAQSGSHAASAMPAGPLYGALACCCLLILLLFAGGGIFFHQYSNGKKTSSSSTSTHTTDASVPITKSQSTETTVQTAQATVDSSGNAQYLQGNVPDAVYQSKTPRTTGTAARTTSVLGNTWELTAQFANVYREEMEKKKEPQPVSLQKYWTRYQGFLKKIKAKEPVPTGGNSIFNGKFDADDIMEDMKESYPIMHGSLLLLADRFLTMKKVFGSSVEKEYYGKMTLLDLFDRTIHNRPIEFIGPDDYWGLHNGKRDKGGWEKVGTEEETKNDDHPYLEKYISYHEMMALTSMIGFSAPTRFINDGFRYNKGLVYNKEHGNHVDKGILMGLAGSRFEKPNVLERALMMVSEKESTTANCYGANTHTKPMVLADMIDDNKFIDEIRKRITSLKPDPECKTRDNAMFQLMEGFYLKSHLPTFDEIQERTDLKIQNVEERVDGRIDLQPEEDWVDYIFKDYKSHVHRADGLWYLDMKMYNQRMRLSMELFLFESDYRASRKGKKAFCHVTGLGAGVWSWDPTSFEGKGTTQQGQVDFEYNEILRNLIDIVRSSVLSNIDAIYFQRWSPEEYIIKEWEQRGSRVVQDAKGKHVTIICGAKEPSAEMEGELARYRDHLLSVFFPWDMASYPGNEYWRAGLPGRYRTLYASGDPASSASSTMPYSLNPDVNKEFLTPENYLLFFFDPKTRKYAPYRLGYVVEEMDKGQEKRNEWLMRSAMSIRSDRGRKEYFVHPFLTNPSTAPYPGSSARRQPLGDNQVPWKMKWDHQPPFYDSDEVKIQDARNDNEYNPADPKSFPSYNFNDFDAVNKVYRISYSGHYKQNSKNLPLNPAGRTGLAGRGVLPRWGPNHVVEPIVTRWKGNHGNILEFVAVQCTYSGAKWGIPSDSVAIDDDMQKDKETGKKTEPKKKWKEEVIPKNLKRCFEETAMKENYNDALLTEFFLKHPVEVYKGRTADERNTDNAWVEIVAVNYHDATGQETKDLQTNFKHQVQWLEIDRRLDLFTPHKWIIQRVAELHNAKW